MSSGQIEQPLDPLLDRPLMNIRHTLLHAPMHP
jgi:hypothetical protein